VAAESLFGSGRGRQRLFLTTTFIPIIPVLPWRWHGDGGCRWRCTGTSCRSQPAATNRRTPIPSTAGRPQLRRGCGRRGRVLPEASALRACETAA
jgi:hypothetical protein